MSSPHKTLLDHALIGTRYFFPQAMALPGASMVGVEGAALACWRSAPPSDRPVLVHWHGNGELVHHWIHGFVPEIQSMGFEVFLAEYRGYGASSGQPRLGAMLEDVGAVLDAVGVPTERMVCFGRSVGSIFAAEAVHQAPDIAGLVIESGVHDVLQRLLLRVRPEEMGCGLRELGDAVSALADQGAKLSSYSGPLLLLHTEHDGIVDIDHAEANLAASGSARKELIRFARGDHNSILIHNEEAYLQAVDRFLTELGMEAV